MAKQAKDEKVKKPTKKEYEVSPELRTLAEEVIAKESLTVTPAKIEYLLVYPNISKTVVGRCKATRGELNFYSKTDYLIEMSGELWDVLDDKVKYIVMLHELKHVMPAMNEKKGEWDFKVREHDIMDFASIIKKYGIDWFATVKTIASSIYELSPEDENSITL